MPYDLIEQNLVDALNNFPVVAIRNRYEDPNWTKGVKAIFGGIGNQRGYKTYFSDGAGCPFNQIQKDISQMLGRATVPNVLNEWLYDILWRKQDENGYVTDIPLVAESEWGNIKEVKKDFQKLLLARSKYRIMIFQGNPQDILDFINWGEEQIRNFKLTQSGDRYLFCGFQWGVREFMFKLYVHL